jgi:hypothetical protein
MAKALSSVVTTDRAPCWCSSVTRDAIKWRFADRLVLKLWFISADLIQLLNLKLEAEAPFYPWFPLESREKKNSSS